MKLIGWLGDVSLKCSLRLPLFYSVSPGQPVGTYICKILHQYWHGPLYHCIPVHQNLYGFLHLPTKLDKYMNRAPVACFFIRSYTRCRSILVQRSPSDDLIFLVHSIKYHVQIQSSLAHSNRSLISIRRGLVYQHETQRCDQRVGPSR